MSEPSGFALSKLFSDLVGRKVGFNKASATPDGSIKQAYGIYKVLPYEIYVVVKAELPLLGSFAGVMVGLPDTEVKQRLKVTPLDELLRDAMHEVLNIASTVVTTEGRAIFETFYTDVTFVSGPPALVLLKPFHRSYFNVTVDGYQGGKFNILAAMTPIGPPK